MTDSIHVDLFPDRGTVEFIGVDHRLTLRFSEGDVVTIETEFALTRPGSTEVLLDPDGDKKALGEVLALFGRRVTAEDPPWGLDGCCPTYEYCPCCGVEWGYQDSLPTSADRFRANWLQRGGIWEDRAVPVDGLTTIERLDRLSIQGKKDG